MRPRPGPPWRHAGVAPKPTNLLDCNGHSTKYQDVKKDLGGRCTDPRGTWGGRFEDNGVYVGHDEPSVKFISSARQREQHDLRHAAVQGPAGQADRSPHGKTVSDYAELSPAPWFGLPICDPELVPAEPLQARQRLQQRAINDPNAAGSAFMEFQFYPPGYQPFVDAPSCDATHWCAALTIDSLESQFNFATCNPPAKSR